jgi:hypothetical protein
MSLFADRLAPATHRIEGNGCGAREASAGEASCQRLADGAVDGQKPSESAGKPPCSPPRHLLDLDRALRRARDHHRGRRRCGRLRDGDAPPRPRLVPRREAAVIACMSRCPTPTRADATRSPAANPQAVELPGGCLRSSAAWRPREATPLRRSKCAPNHGLAAGADPAPRLPGAHFGSAQQAAERSTTGGGGSGGATRRGSGRRTQRTRRAPAHSPRDICILRSLSEERVGEVPVPSPDWSPATGRTHSQRLLDAGVVGAKSTTPPSRTPSVDTALSTRDPADRLRGIAACSCAQAPRPDAGFEMGSHQAPSRGGSV